MATIAAAGRDGALTVIAEYRLVDIDDGRLGDDSQYDESGAEWDADAMQAAIFELDLKCECCGQPAACVSHGAVVCNACASDRARERSGSIDSAGDLDDVPWERNASPLVVTHAIRSWSLMGLWPPRRQEFTDGVAAQEAFDAVVAEAEATGEPVTYSLYEVRPGGSDVVLRWY